MRELNAKINELEWILGNVPITDPEILIKINNRLSKYYYERRTRREEGKSRRDIQREVQELTQLAKTECKRCRCD